MYLLHLVCIFAETVAICQLGADKTGQLIPSSAYSTQPAEQKNGNI